MNVTMQWVKINCDATGHFQNLPETEGLYIFSFRDGTVDADTFLMEFLKDGTFGCLLENHKIEDVVAWMTLPAPYV